jgi:hypothetical protein
MNPLAANQMRWRHQPGHYEVWYATFSHVPSKTGFWIRYTMESPREGHGAPYAQLWFARFDRNQPEKTFGINQRFPLDQMKVQAPFRVQIGDSELRHDGMHGQLGGASWDLKWQPSDHLHRHLPDLAYRGKWADTQVLSPNLNVAAHGLVTVEGERYELQGAPLGQTHLWGKKHAYQWAWSHCNSFEGDRGVALETLSVRLKRGQIVLPTLTLLSLYLEGDKPDLLDFREFHQLPLTRSSWATGRYELEATGARWRVEAKYTCRPEDMIQTEYVDPDGEPAWCHNTECADCEVRILKRGFYGNWQEYRKLRSDGGAHWEWGARAGDPLVRKRHVTLG